MSDRNKGNNFLIQGSILAIASLLVRVIGLIYKIPLQRIIGTEGMGLYQVSFGVYNIALLLSSYSLPLAVSRLVAVRRAKKEHRNAYRVFLCAMGMAIVTGLIAMLVIFFGADGIANLMGYPDIALPLRVLAPTIFVFAIMGVLRGFYQGKNTMIPTAVSQVLEQVVNAVVSIVAAYFLMKHYHDKVNAIAYGAAGSTLGTLSGAVVSLIFLLFIFVLYKPMVNRQNRKDISGYREGYKIIFKVLLLTIAPVILSQTVYQISGLIDTTLFGNIMGDRLISAADNEVLLSTIGAAYTSSDIAKLTGIYSNNYLTLVNVPIAIATAMGAASIASLSADYAHGNYDGIRSKVKASVKFNMVIAIPSAVGMGVLAAPIMAVVWNEGSRLSANVMILGCISIVFYALSTITTAVLQGINKMNIPLINSAISLFIHIILVFCLLKFTDLSVYALVVGNVTFPLVVCILNWLSVEKHLDYRQEIIKTFVVPAVSAALMGVVTGLTYWGLHNLTDSIMASLVLSILVAVVVYFIILVFLKGISEEELSRIPKGHAVVKVMKKLHML
ncbi:MAG TPA: polysaccharide biosynthesis protein [Clostridiales bacterium]|nr:polysaccharide biosynthesis protein [Clostridiales bacterium]